MTNTYSIQLAFKQLFSMTIDEYSKELRMKRAKDLLRDTSSGLDDIADEVGYSDGATVSRWFKKCVRGRTWRVEDPH